MSTTTSKSLNMNSVNYGRLSQRFDLIRKLGQGTYGKVQLGINKLTGVEVALKTIKKSKIESSSDLLRIKREITIMSCCNHPNIIHIYEVYENKEKIILVMEYAQGGELYDYLNEKKKLDEDEAKRIFAQIASAIYYCHKHQITHRDLKLENVLLDHNLNAKIADFGLSNVYGDQLLKTFCGSPLYASPEIVKGIPYHGPEVDCWSLGVLLYTLVYGSMPFDGTHFKKLVKQITSGSFYEPTIKSGGAELIRSLLTVDSKRRYNIQQVVAHPWLQSTECQSISEEYCNLAPVKGEYLVGINKSDTLDEVSEISSTSLEDNDSTKQKSKQKPPRRSPKPTDSDPPSAQPPVIEPVQAKPPEDKVTKPSNDKAKTDVPKVTTATEKVKVQSEATKVTEPTQTGKVKPSEHTKPESGSKAAAVKTPECAIKEKVSPAPVCKSAESEKVSPSPARKGTSPAPTARKGGEAEKTSPAAVRKGTSPARKTADSDKASPVPAHKGGELGKEPPAPIKTADKTRLDVKVAPESEAKGQSKSKPEEKPKEVVSAGKPETLKPKTESKRKSPAKETTIEPTHKPASTVPVPSVVSNVSGTAASTATETAKPTVILRNQRSTSTPTSEEASSPTTPIPGKTERRNSKTIAPKTAEIIQNITESGKVEPAEPKKTVAPVSKLSDIKKKFENGQLPKPDESGIGSILKRRKSIVESGELDGQGQEVKVTTEKLPETPISIPVTQSLHNQQPITTATPTPITRSVKPPQPTKGSPVPKVLNLVIERESDIIPPPVTIKPEVIAPTARSALKLIMPKPTAKVLSQPPVSASPPITKQGAVKKIGSLINKAKSNEISAAHSSGSRERVIPIQFEDDLSSPVSRSGTGGTSGSHSPRTGSISISILSSDGAPSSRPDSRAFASHGSPASTISSPSYSRHNSFGNEVQNQIGGCQIMKSKREFIIPITIEARDDSGDTAPAAADLLTRRNSSTATASSSGASSSSRVYSSRRHTSSNLSLLSPDSTDLDDDFFDDDDFLSSDALFTSLLQRVRGLRISDRCFNDNKNTRRNGRWATNLDFKRN